MLGDAAVAAQLAQFLPGRRIQERPVEVRPLARIEDLGDAEVLFIGRQQNARLAQLIAAVARRPTLVVTDADDGLDRGAMVNFQLVDERVRFEISVPRAEEAGLTLSSRLLSAALARRDVGVLLAHRAARRLRAQACAAQRRARPASARRARS